MRFNYPVAVSVVMVFLLGTTVSVAQSINLTAKSAMTTLPDGQVVPMWGFSCKDAGTAPAFCAAANPNSGGSWSPVVITVPPGSLTINLTNMLPVPPGAQASKGIPTSLVIVGQLGGGLGATPSRVPSPTHAPQGTTWPIANSPGVTFS